MSYEIVKGLKIKRDVKEVWIKASSNNVTPKYYAWENAVGLTGIYKRFGEEVAIKQILELYWNGCLQPGTQNNFSKAVHIFNIKNPSIQYNSIGDDVRDEVLALGPIEDLPKYLNIRDPRQREIIKERLGGKVFDPKYFKPKILMTKEELLNELYSIYKNFPKRKKAKHIIGVDGDYFHSTYGPYRIRITPHKDQAYVFHSWEDAAIKCSKLNFSTNAIKEA